MPGKGDYGVGEGQGECVLQENRNVGNSSFTGNPIVCAKV
jgi:hypothetical protein